MAVQADDVRSGKEFSKIDVWYSIVLGNIIRIRVIGDDRAAETFRKYLASQQSNLPRTDDANGFAGKIESCETVKEEVAFANAVVNLVVFSDYGQYQPDGELCDCFGRVWSVNDFDADLGSSFEVDVIAITRTT